MQRSLRSSRRSSSSANGTRRTGQIPIASGRPASLTLRESRQKPDPAQSASGSGAMSAKSADTGPRRVEGSARGWAGFERSWQDASTSSCLDTRPRPPTSGGSARPLATSAGGAAAGSVKRATTCLSGAGGGCPRSEDYGRESRRAASGGPPGSPPSASSSETCVGPRRFWSS